MTTPIKNSPLLKFETTQCDYIERSIKNHLQYLTGIIFVCIIKNSYSSEPYLTKDFKCLPNEIVMYISQFIARRLFRFSLIKKKKNINNIKRNERINDNELLNRYFKNKSIVEICSGKRKYLLFYIALYEHLYIDTYNMIGTIEFKMPYNSIIDKIITKYNIIN